MQLAKRTAHIPVSCLCSFFDAAEERQRKGQSIINMVMGRPDFPPPAHINEAIKKSIDDGHVHYTSNYGLLELRKAVAEKLLRENGVQCNPEKGVLITAGVSEGLQLCMTALVNPGDEVIVPAPAFLSYDGCVRAVDGVPVFVHTRQEDAFQPQLADLEKAVTSKSRVLLINSPQNPTGTVYTRTTLQMLADFAIGHDLVVISDEINEKIIFDGEEHVSIAALPGMAERTIVLNGFSKAYAMTGSRIGYAAGPEQFILPMYCAHQYSAMCPCTFAQWGALAALQGPQDFCCQMATELDRRRLMLMERLSAMPGVQFVRPKGAFYIMLAIPTLGTPMQAGEFLLDAGLAIVPWDAQHLRLSYANSYENLSLAMDRMEKALCARLK